MRNAVAFHAYRRPSRFSIERWGGESRGRALVQNVAAWAVKCKPYDPHRVLVPEETIDLAVPVYTSCKQNGNVHLHRPGLSTYDECEDLILCRSRTWDSKGSKTRGGVTEVGSLHLAILTSAFTEARTLQIDNCGISFSRLIIITIIEGRTEWEISYWLRAQSPLNAEDIFIFSFSDAVAQSK